MRWYSRSAADHDTHASTRGHGVVVVAECGAQFRPEGSLFAPSGQIPYTEKVCVVCYAGALPLGEGEEFLALQQVANKGIAYDRLEFVARGLPSRLAALLFFVLQRLMSEGMVALADPDERGLTFVELTSVGQERFHALCSTGVVPRPS